MQVELTKEQIEIVLQVLRHQQDGNDRCGLTFKEDTEVDQICDTLKACKTSIMKEPSKLGLYETKPKEAIGDWAPPVYNIEGLTSGQLAVIIISLNKYGGPIASELLEIMRDK